MGSGPEFDIMLNSEKLYYRKQSSFSYLFSDEGDVYIVPAFLFGVVKKLRIIENKLYLYV